MEGGDLYSPGMACVRPMGKVNGTVTEFIDVFADIVGAALCQARLVTHAHDVGQHWGSRRDSASSLSESTR